MKPPYLRVIAAFLFVIILWSTTPLAIKWSGEGPGYLFGVASRMTIGLACMLPALLLLRQKMPWSKNAWQTYFAIALQIYGAMIAVYWGAQFIPSGWVSVIFGLTPMMTAIMASFCLNESSLGPFKLLSYISGFAGLLIMFGSASELSPDAILGIAAVVLATLIQSISAVLVKRIHAGIPVVCQVTGGLLIAVPLYLATWFWQDGQWPATVPTTSLMAIIYLGAIATTIGFALYFYVLTHLPATRVALITLITPVASLILGSRINNEPMTEKVIFGSALILAALLLHQLSNRRLKRS